MLQGNIYEGRRIDRRVWLVKLKNHDKHHQIVIKYLRMN